MFQLSAAEGDRFRQIADEMTARVAKLGPSSAAKLRGKGAHS
jgi:coenzyme F420-reducing hydrogenase delta subunit